MADNIGLFEALSRAQRKSAKVIAVFIFDPEILSRFPNPEDRRVDFLFGALEELKKNFRAFGSDLWVVFEQPLVFWDFIFRQKFTEALAFNEDYEPKTRLRDQRVKDLAQTFGVPCRSFKDQVIFARDEISKDDGSPYTVFTPYLKKWMSRLKPPQKTPSIEELREHLRPVSRTLPGPSLEELGYRETQFEFPVGDDESSWMEDYLNMRNYPWAERGTSRLGVHLRFGTVSVREWVEKAKYHQPWLNELVWREFFKQILWHFPRLEKECFRKKYEAIKWRNSEEEFRRWKEGATGYPLVDAGLRELQATGHMHNRVRMAAASFLCKHLLIDWRWGERHFADLLLDYDLSSNNGNWQWAAGTGCDAAPYFRVFNPSLQQKKFDKDFIYIKKWIPEFGSLSYPKPMVDHVFGRQRALHAYRVALEEGKK